MKAIKTKKSMFIATLLIVVLLVAAVATATYAWFITNEIVTAESATLSAAKADGINLGIGWTSGAALTGNTNTYINFGESANDDIMPMIPSIEPDASVTYTAFVASFRNSPINADNLFTSTPVTLPAGGVATLGNGAGVDTIFVANRNQDDTPVMVTITAALTDGADAELNNLLKIAVFARIGDGGDHLYQGTLSFGGNAYWGTIVSGNAGIPAAHSEEGTPFALQTFSTAANNVAGFELLEIEGQEVLEVRLVAWFDGVGLINDFAEMTSNFEFTFTGSIK